MRVFLLLGLFLAFFCTALWAGEPLRVGVILPLTGYNDFLGERCRKAIEMSMEDLPANQRAQLKLFWEDDRAVLKDSVLAAQRLCSQEKVDVLISYGAGTLKVIAPIAKQHDVVHLNTSVNRQFADGENNFSFWGRPENASKLIVDQLKQEGKKTVAVLYAQTDPSILHTQAFIKAVQNAGLTIVAEEKFNPGERDFRIALLKLNEKKPDIIYVFAWFPEIEIILRQARQTGITTPFTGIESFNYIQDLSLVEGLWYTTGTCPSADFQKRYAQRYHINGNFCESQFYDFIQILGELSVSSPEKRLTRPQIAAWLKKIHNRPGASGIINVLPSGEIMLPSLLAEFKNGQRIEIKKYPMPQPLP